MNQELSGLIELITEMQKLEAEDFQTQILWSPAAPNKTVLQVVCNDTFVLHEQADYLDRVATNMWEANSPAAFVAPLRKCHREYIVHKELLEKAEKEKLLNRTVSALQGKSFVKVEHLVHRHGLWQDEIRFYLPDGKYYLMGGATGEYADVYAESIVGDLQDLVNTPIILAEEVNNFTLTQEQQKMELASRSCTWTFYRFRTIKGDVDIRWFGGSNGYYSEEVEISLEDPANA